MKEKRNNTSSIWDSIRDIQTVVEPSIRRLRTLGFDYDLPAAG